ncbi:unnamed protein product [Meganyctiphanes norvegica]|uniref:separase n=1 Tax=Meganyctiphanes norvegica TaxID=48144 RepID=A0AAV2QD16_MEGNR
MTASFQRLQDSILSRLEAPSLTAAANVLPSPLTTGVYIEAANADLDSGDNESAFANLSLTHSTLVHHRVTQRQQKSKNDDSPQILALKKESLSATSKEETLNLLKQLPSDWTVVQITAANNGGIEHFLGLGEETKVVTSPSLFIAHCRCGPSPTVTVQYVDPPKNEGVRSIIQEIESIKESNRNINQEWKDQQEKYVNKREEVNDRLKCLVRSMEVSWLRHWCSLLPGTLDPQKQQILTNIIDKALINAGITLSQSQKILLQSIISCPNSSEKSGNKILGSTPLFSMRAGIAAVLEESVRGEKSKELSSILQKLEDTLEEIRNETRNPVILVLDKAVVSLPWEMLSVLRDQPVTRMPSLRMLTLLFQHHSQQMDSVLVKGVNPNNGFYILDPDSNLKRTQDRMKDVLAQSGWTGVTGRHPSHTEFKDALGSKDVFTYIGHGSGSQYFPGELVENTKCRSLVLLYGCSSARLAPRGRIPDPWGIILNYFIASCPCVVGMLWEVTDKDTDKVTQVMLRALLGQGETESSTLANPPTDVALLVSRSRGLCHWYSTAAALVVYGLPLHLVHTEEI